MNHSEIIEILADVKEAFPMQPMEDSTVRLWTRTLGDLDFRTTRRVVDEWIMTEEYPPKIASIRNRVLQDTSGLPTPDEAYLMVIAWQKKNYPGIPAKETWDAPQIVQDALTDIGKLYMFRQMDADTGRKAYITAYKKRIDRSRKEDAALEANTMKELLG